jgi:hypothetical protein
LVVAQGEDRFACVEPRAALALSGCHDGDFVTMDAFGRLRCQSISTSSTTKALLPNCSSGQFLQSDGGGSWKCVPASSTMPSCSSGQILVSEGSSGWRCTDQKR